MRDFKHIRRFNESEENLNISDVSDSKFNKLFKKYGKSEIVSHISSISDWTKEELNDMEIEELGDIWYSLDADDWLSDD